MTACAACTMTSDTDEGMVGCDGCNNWYHYRCVGVVEKDIRKQEKWFCPAENCQKTEADLAKKLEENRKKGSKGKKTLGVDDASDKSSSKSDRQSGSSFEKKMIALEKEQRAKEKEIEEERQLWEKRLAMERILKEKRLQMETEMRQREMKQEKELLEKALREQQEHLNQMERMRERYQAKMADVKMKLNTSGAEKKILDKNHDSLERLRTLALQEKPGGSKEIGKGKKKKTEPEVEEEEQGEEESSDEESENSSGSGEEEEEEESEESEEESEQETEEESDEDEKMKKKNKKQVKKAVPHGLGQQLAGPTKAQMAARNGISRKLPIFSGKPEEWPLFKGSYEASNKTCGYNDIENLVRLQECLKGPALESVRGQLLSPKSVPKVMEKLRQLYGRPKQLLHFHLEKVNRLESPKAERLETFIPFGNAVEQLCDHLEAADLKQHLVNPLMRQREMKQEQELLEKALREQREHLTQMERMRERYQVEMADVKMKLNTSGTEKK